MNLSNYYRKATIYPSIFILIFCAIFSLMNNIKSEWLIVKSDLTMSLITSAIYCLIMCLLSLSIYLNKWYRVNKKLYWNILTWFLLPSAYILMVIVFEIKTRINFNLGFGRDFIYLLVVILPFGVGLYASFKEYRKTIN